MTTMTTMAMPAHSIRPMRFVWLVLGLAFVCGSTVGADEPARDLSEAVEALRAEHDLPAASALVLHRGVIAAEGVAGVRRKGGESEATLEDRWHLGSCTKSMTATLIAVLVEKGEVSWELTIPEALAEIDSEIHDDYRAITLSDLVHNRGRIGQPSDVDKLWGVLWARRGTPTAERRKAARAMLSTPARLETGAYEYSNLGFSIAGHMVETRLGTPWEELMQTHVFKPLGITTAGYGVPWEGMPPSDPWPHRADGTPVPPGRMADNPPSIGPAGTVHMSMRDWSKYIADHCRGARGEDGILLTSESYASLHTAIPAPANGYAKGWNVTARAWARGSEDGASGRCLTHSGSNTTWYCMVWIAPELELAVLCATNAGGEGIGPKLDQLLWGVLGGELDRLKAASKEEAIDDGGRSQSRVAVKPEWG